MNSGLALNCVLLPVSIKLYRIIRTGALNATGFLECVQSLPFLKVDVEALALVLGAGWASFSLVERGEGL